MRAEVGPFEDRLDDFDRAWRDSETPPQLQDFIDASGDDRQELLFELVKVDLEYRWRGDQPAVTGSAVNELLPMRPYLEDYVRAYSDLGSSDQLPTDLICEEYRVRCRWGDSPNHDDYRSRFPNQGEQVTKGLIDIDTEINDETRTNFGRHTSVVTPPGEAPPNDAAAGSAPEMIGKYRVIAPISRGGQARVFRALHPTLSRELVIKIGHAGLRQEHQALLIAEGELLAGFDHPNLARVYDLDFERGVPYLVIEYVRGQNLAQYAEQGKMDAHDAARIIAKLARAIAYIHARGVVHQDIKPANAIIDENGEARLIDFGLAKLRDAWTAEDPQRSGISGTVAYMATEQALGNNDQVGPSSDIFALGAVLYFLLAGEAPFYDRDLERALEKAQRCDFDKSALDRPDIPQRLRQVCLTAMQEKMSDRYANAEALAADLESIANPKKRPKYTAAAIVCVLALGLAGYAVLQKDSGNDPAQPTTPVVATTLAQLNRHPQGRSLRQDFVLEMEMPGGELRSGERVVYASSQKCAVYARVDRPCYLGLWYVDGSKAQFEVNRIEFNKRIEAGDRVEVVRFDLAPSTGPEFIHLVASTVPLAQLSAEQLEPYVFGAEPGDTPSTLR